MIAAPEGPLLCCSFAVLSKIPTKADRGVYATDNFAFSVISLFSDKPWIKERSWGVGFGRRPFFMEQCC